MRARVLLTVPHLSSTASPYRELIAIARHLPKAEFELVVCSLRSDGLDTTGPLLADLGVRSLVARFRPRGHRPRHWLASLQDTRRLRDFGPFALQHSLDFTTLPFEALLARLAGRRFVFSQRNLNPNGHPALLATKIRLANGIVAISQAALAALPRAGLGRRLVRVIPLGIDPLDLPERKQRYELSPVGPVLVVGHLVPLKRYADAIRAVGMLADEFPRLELWIVGQEYDRAYAAGLRSLASELGLSERVRFLGPREDAARLMQEAALLVSCSESEAFSWVVLEAMAVGLPVVATRSGGPQELIDHGVDGALVAVGDTAALAQAIRELLERPDLARQRAAAGSAKAGRLSAAGMVERLAQMYRDVLGRGQ